MSAEAMHCFPLNQSNTMKLNKLNFLILAAATVLTGHAQAAVITNFSSFTQSPNLLPDPNLLTQSFSTTTGVGTNTVTGTATGGSGAAGQAMYLSDSFSLATVGARISASFGSFAGTGTGSQAIGLVVANTEVKTNRNDSLAFFFRRDLINDLGYFATNGSAESTSGFVSIGSNTTNTHPDSIFIERTSNGYILGSITGVTTTNHFTLTIGSGNLTTTGAAVGIYSDVRSTNNVNTLVNFAHIPEPSAALLGGLGMLVLLRRRRA